MSKYVVCRTVEDLIEELRKLPPELRSIDPLVVIRANIGRRDECFMVDDASDWVEIDDD